MKRKNKRPRWRCLKCRMKMHAQLAPKANEIVAGVAAAESRRGMVVHLCGACKELHLEDGRGGLRRPTAAEMFEIQMQLGGTLDAIGRATFPATDVPTGTLVIPRN